MIMFSLKRTLVIGSVALVLVGCETGASQQQQSSVIINSGALYATPESAVDALVTANREGDERKLMQIFGPQAEKLVHSGDAVADEAGQKKFVGAYDAYHRLESDGGDKQLLVVGAEEWPLPIPLVHENDGWRFDVAEGQQMIIARRIGRNELNVIKICREFVVAQREFAQIRKRVNGFIEYAQRIDSKIGTHDGLYWPVGPRETQSPLGPLLADAQAEGYETISGRHTPYHGYYFRILKRQGPAAPAGEKDYVVNEHMTGGFALLATPAIYGDSGIKSFIVNQNGIVYEADLGSDTVAAAAQIRAYDPDANWQPVR
jgi:hypothetical protein